MINPSKVELLIFDLDGTIFQSEKANFESVREAFLKTNIGVDISGEKVREYLGEFSEEFYKNILPLDKRAAWQEVRAKTREQYDTSSRRFGRVFPDVKETLELLKKRGYKLVLYSNCSVQYFNAAISALNIGDYFDYAESNQENNLDKIELVKKIKDKFSNADAAVIGDRIHDIAAAKENNALSVGALYGYGKDEPRKADITINKFPELLDIFDRRLPIFGEISEEIKKRKQKDKIFIIGITGIDTSGKTKFAESFNKFLKTKDYKTQVINLDDFHNPKKIRYVGDNQADNYYNKSFDIKTIVEKLLIPIRQKINFSTTLNLLNLHTDRYDVEKEFFFDQDTIVIFEGVFLFRKEISSYLDYKIFTEVSLEESKRRAKARDVPIYGEDVLKKYDEKYLPAQKKYLGEFPPSLAADMMIDNNDWEQPKIR